MTPRRAISLGLVGLLHVALIYAVVSGLALRIVKHVPPVLEATIVEPSTPEQKDVTVPKPQMAQPEEATVPPPDFQIQTDTNPPMQAAPAQQTPASPPASATATGVGSTHTTPPYPEQERRQGVEGTVTLHLSITAEGTVSNAAVVKSSGNADLDSTAVAWVIAHWKYKPALADGQPVASAADANVVYDLKKAR
jgi:protein TonB